MRLSFSIHRGDPSRKQSPIYTATGKQAYQLWCLLLDAEWNTLGQTETTDRAIQCVCKGDLQIRDQGRLRPLIELSSVSVKVICRSETKLGAELGKIHPHWRQAPSKAGGRNVEGSESSAS